jgi:diaminopimelate decarboxylase
MSESHMSVPPSARPLPDSAAIDDGELAIGGFPVSTLARELGTPLVVYCEETMLARARAYRQAAPKALVAYGVKAFVNVAAVRLFAHEGLGADVWSFGELTTALHAGVQPEAIVVNGCNKTEDELRHAADLGVAYVVMDNFEEIPQAAAAGVERVLLRLKPGIDASAALRTGHRRSKFGFAEPDVVDALARAEDQDLDVAGFHVHIGSQMLESADVEATIEWLGRMAEACRRARGWTPRILDLGGGLGIPYTDESPLTIPDFVGRLTARVEATWRALGLPQVDLVFEPGRSLVGQSGVTLYTVGSVKRIDDDLRYVIVDGGISDNPRPHLYGARYGAFVATRMEDAPTGVYTVCGKHCESDVLIDEIRLPDPRRGDLLAVPSTGAYTLAMGSNYNGVPRPAAVLVREGTARVIERRETMDDLLARQVQEELADAPVGV